MNLNFEILIFVFTSSDAAATGIRRPGGLANRGAARGGLRSGVRGRATGTFLRQRLL